MKSIKKAEPSGRKSSELLEETLFWKKTGNQILITIIFSLLVGHAWHIRGSGPWGGMGGMWAVGTLTVLYIFVIFGDRAKATKTWLGLMVVLMALTTGGWGTLNRQITGRFHGADFDIAVNPLSGAFYVFVIGFGWAPLFGFALGYFMGDRKYEFKELVGAIIAFYISVLIGKLLLAHLVIPYTAKDAYNLFAYSVQEETGATPWSFYMDHFFSASYLKKFPGGRNYESMVSNLGDSFGALGLSIYLYFGIKDKKSARYTLIVSFILGTGILIADLWQFWGQGCLFQAAEPNIFSEQGSEYVLAGEYSCKPPKWLRGDEWGMWEYFTGFLFGMGLSIFLLRQKAREYINTAQVKDTMIPSKFQEPLTLLSYDGIVLFAAVWFPIGSIVGRWAEQESWWDGDSFPWSYLLIGIAGVIYLAMALSGIKRRKHASTEEKRKYFKVSSTKAFKYLIGYWTLFFALDQFLTPHGDMGWRGVPAYLDIISYCLGLPLLCFLYYKIVINKKE